MAKFALIGSGEYLPPMEPVDRALLARVAGPPRVVCLPTAAGAESPERIAYWMQLGVDHFTQLGAHAESLPVVDRASADDQALAQAVAAANFVYLSGGKPGYLYGALSGTRVWAAVQEVLAQGGLLAGCSAGAMVLGERFFGFPSWKPGFNFLPGMTIIPHFDQIPAVMLTPARLLLGHELVILGIEANTARVKDGEAYTVLGSGGVTVWGRQEKKRYTAGRLTFTD